MSNERDLFIRIFYVLILSVKHSWNPRAGFQFTNLEIKIINNLIYKQNDSLLVFSSNHFVEPHFGHGSPFLYLFLQITFLARCHYPSGPRVTSLVAIRNQPCFLRL